MATAANGGGGSGSGGGTGPAGAGAGAPPAFSTVIPETYRDKEWVKQNAKDPETFFKFVDNLNTVVGKKGVIIPGEKATPEEIGAFRSALGVPGKPEEYEFETPQEMKDAKRVPETDIAIKKLMHEAGIPKDSAKKLQLGFEKYMYGEHLKVLEANKLVDKAFDDTTTKLFGDQKDLAITNAKKLLQENNSPEVLTMIDKLDNNALIVLTAALNGIVNKYIKEDAFKGGGAGAGGSGSDTYEALSAAQRELMKNPAYQDWRHADHQKIMDQNTAIMNQMRNIKK